MTPARFAGRRRPVSVRNDAFPLGVGCGRYQEYPDGFLCFIDPGKPFVRRWFRRVPTVATVERVAGVLHAALAAHPDVRDLRWWTDAEAAGGRAWETAIEQLAAAREVLPVLYEIWRVRADGETWENDAGYFRWRGETYGVEAVHDELLVRKLDPAEWEARSRWIPYSPPVLEAVVPVIAPAPRADRSGEQMYDLSAADFEQLFRYTPLRLEHGRFLEFFRTEVEEARRAARHAAESGERVVFYTY